MICLYKERDIFKNGFTNVLNFAFTNVVYLVRKLNVSCYTGKTVTQKKLYICRHKNLSKTECKK
jgi:hypothetical protein